MKKMIVSLMLIISMFAFAAESAPSATVGYVKYSNVTTAGTDLNHVAIPVTNGWTISSNIDPAGTYYNSISKWNPVTQTYTVSSRLGVWLTPFAVAPGDHLVLNAKVNNDLIVNGTVNTIPAYNFIVTSGSDLNHFMLPLTKTNLTTTTLLGNDIATCNSISKWNSATQVYQVSSKLGVWLTPYAVGITDPLVVNMTAAKTWPSSKVYEEVTSDEPIPKIGNPRQIFIGIYDNLGNPYDFTAGYDNVTMLAWIRGRESETQTDVLTDFGMGNTVSIGYYDVGAFTTPWLPGDVLVTRFVDGDNMLAKEYEFVLDNSTDPIGVGVDTFLGAGVSTVAQTTPILLDIPSSIENGVLPVETKLHQNYPNPFNPTTTIKFDLASNSVVKLNVYNYNGQLVKSLVNGQMNAGYHSVNFDASSLSAGVYYYTMSSANKTMTQKMVLVK